MPGPGTSKVGTIDPMGKTRVYTDEFLKPVAAGSAEAAFVFKRGDLARLQDRRTELGLDKNDDALRAQLDSRKAAIAAAVRKEANAKDELATLKAQLDQLQAEHDAFVKGKATGKAEAKAEATETAQKDEAPAKAEAKGK